MLDVHILKAPYTPEEVFNQCLSSVERASANSPYPVNVFVVDGIYGHLGQARHNGYSCGSGNYKTHVDDDDWVDDNAFNVLPLGNNTLRYNIITTGETHIVNNKVLADRPNNRHHLAVFNSDWLARQTYQQFKFHPDQYLLSLEESYHIPDCVYNHRLDINSGSRRCRTENRDEATQEYNMIKTQSKSGTSYPK